MRAFWRNSSRLGPPSSFLLVFALLLASSPAHGQQPAAGAQDDQARVAQLLRITAPLENVERVRRAIRRFVNESRESGKWPLLFLEIENGRYDFGQALDLARFLSGSELDGATTVAFLPKGATGHTVLIALACDEIAMPAQAEIGDAGIHEEAIGADLRSVYKEIAQRRRTIPADVALGMLDPNLEVLQVETEVSREYVLRDRLDQLQQRHAITNVKVLIPAGHARRFAGSAAKELGFVGHLAEDRAELARAWRIPPAALDENPALVGGWKPIQVNIRGPIHVGLVHQIERMLDKRASGANLIVLYLDSAGGSPADSNELAKYLARLSNKNRRTVAYIPREAAADAAFVALACDQIVMHPQARLGGSWTRALPPDEAAAMAQSLSAIAEARGHSAALAAGFADPNVEVFRYRNSVDGSSELLTSQQAEQLPNRQQWERGQAITRAGEPIELDGNQAVELGLTRAVVGDYAEFKALYGLEHDPGLVEPTWVDVVVNLLNSDAAGWALLVLAAIGLYIEAQSPGLGVGGFAAGLCFLLYFWSHYLGGTADWLEILLFAAGALCILLEIFILPGVGVFAFGGGALILISILLASQTFVLPRDDYEAVQMLRSLFVFSGVFVGFVVAALFVRRLLPRTPGLGQMVLMPPTPEEQQQQARREALTDYDHLLGAGGATVTPLIPAGKARFGDEIVNVLAEGEFLPPGTNVRVVEVRGNRVLVRPDDTRRSST
jgi:membrane-bound ClpP family serine protease